jgi:hypothetical protein
VGWREETGASAFQRRREVGRRPAKLCATLWLCEWEEDVRPSPTGRGGNGEESARRQLLPRRGDGVGGATEFAVRGGALMVGAVEKAMGRGLARGVLRSEDGKRVEARWRPFEWGRGEAGERGSEGGRRDHSAGRRHRLTGGPEQHSARRCEFKLDSKYFKRIQICPKL